MSNTITFSPEAHISYFNELPDLAQEFVNSRANSTGSQTKVASYLREFFAIVGVEPEEVTIHHWDKFAAHLNQQVNLRTGKLIATSTKLYYHANVKSFFDYCAPRFQRAGKNVFVMPKFKYSGLTIVPREETNNEDAKVIPNEGMAKILQALRGHGYDKYIMGLIKKHTGMRAGEDVSIQLKDLHLDATFNGKRIPYIGTCLLDGGRKSNKEGKHPIPFPIPPFVADEIKIYVQMYLLPRFPGTQFLFPAIRSSMRGHFTAASLEHLCAEVSNETGVALKSHWFRHTLNSNRKYVMGCENESTQQQLLHHVNTKAIMKYDLPKIAQLHALYMKYHPYFDL